jgi:hypothetical protein
VPSRISQNESSARRTAASEPRRLSCGHGGELHENGGALDVRAGFAEEGEELLGGCIRAHGRSPWADGTSVGPAASQRDLSVRSGQGKEEYALLAILSVWRTGRLRQDPGRAAESPAETRTYGDGGGV